MVLRRGSVISVLAFACVLLAGCGRESPAPGADGGVIDLREWNFERDGPVTLGGEWRFYWRKFAVDITPADRPLFVSHGRWDRFEIDGLELDAAGFATYRLEILLPGEHPQLALSTGYYNTSARLLIPNGDIHSIGMPGREAKNTRPVTRTDLVDFPRTAGRAVLSIEVANFHHRKGGMVVPPSLGTPAQLNRRKMIGTLLPAALASVYFLFGLYHLIVHAFRRNPAALWFGIVCILLALRSVLFGEQVLRLWLPELGFQTRVAIEYLTIYLMTATSARWLFALFPGEMPRRLRDVFVAVSLLFVLTLFMPAMTLSRLHPPFQFWIVALFLTFLAISVRAIMRGRPGARLALLGVLILLIGTVFNLLESFLGAGRFPYISIVVLAFIGVQSAALARNFSSAFNAVESLSGALAERNRELDRKNVELTALDRLKDEFLAKTSHELRTPLLGIIGMADALRDEEDRERNAESRRRLELIVASGRRLSRLVGDILDFSKLRHGDLRLKVAPLFLRPLVQLQIEIIAYNVAPERKLALFNDVPDDLPAVSADEERLTQILQNLLGNAVKFTNEGEIRVGARRADGDMIEIEVSDTGTGIATADRDRVFEPFEQTSGSTGGTGLGLSIARSLVELQGGRMWIGSGEGPGTKVNFTLPVSTASPVAPVAVSTEAPAPPLAMDISFGPETSGDHSVRRNGRYVLVVDDEPVNLEVMRSYLESTDTRVELAADALAARKALASGPLPECLVLDIMMPGTSGLELARELRLRYARADLPILMVTAKTRTADLMAAIDAGANDYLTKPFEKKEFLLRVNNLVELAETHRDVERGEQAVREAAKRERVRINSDLHDHLGAALTDLKLFSESAGDNQEVKPEFARRLQEKVDSAVSLLRNDLLDLEDLSLLEDDFLAGIQMIILRRYVAAGRVMDFRVQESGEEELAARLDNGRVSVMYSVIKEMVTNDLKYGTGRSDWEFSWNEAELRIDFHALSRYRLSRHGTGQGTAGMIRRLTQIGGSLRMNMQETDGGEADQAIEIEIALPF